MTGARQVLRLVAAAERCLSCLSCTTGAPGFPMRIPVLQTSRYLPGASGRRSSTHLPPALPVPRTPTGVFSPGQEGAAPGTWLQREEV